MTAKLTIEEQKIIHYMRTTSFLSLLRTPAQAKELWLAIDRNSLSKLNFSTITFLLNESLIVINSMKVNQDSTDLLQH